MTGLSLADVIAVGSWMALLVALNVGFYAWFRLCNYVLDKVWPHALPPSETPAEYRSIPVLVHPYVVTLTGSGRKGFEHRSTVVDLAERRRNRRVH